MASGRQGQDENQIGGPSLSVLLPLLPHPQLGHQCPEEEQDGGQGAPSIYSATILRADEQ